MARAAMGPPGRDCPRGPTTRLATTPGLPEECQGSGPNPAAPADMARAPLPPEVEVRLDFELPQASERFVYAANPSGGTVSIIDADSLAIQTLETGSRPTFLRTLGGLRRRHRAQCGFRRRHHHPWPAERRAHLDRGRGRRRQCHRRGARRQARGCLLRQRVQHRGRRLRFVPGRDPHHARLRRGVGRGLGRGHDCRFSPQGSGLLRGRHDRVRGHRGRRLGARLRADRGSRNGHREVDLPGREHRPGVARRLDHPGRSLRPHASGR